MRKEVKKPGFLKLLHAGAGFTPLHPESLGLQAEDEWKIKLEVSEKAPSFRTGVTGFTFIELLVVIGIFSSIFAATFVLLTTSRSSAGVNEAKVQTKEYAQIAMERMVRELRLSRIDRVCIANSIGWAPTGTEPNPGSVINFQIPVGIYGTLSLTGNNALQWGSADNVGYYLAYSIDANSNLLRNTYTAPNGFGLTSRVIAPHISTIRFSRASISSGLIHIEITARVQTSFGPITQTLSTDVRLRN